MICYGIVSKSQIYTKIIMYIMPSVHKLERGKIYCNNKIFHYLYSCSSYYQYILYMYSNYNFGMNKDINMETRQSENTTK